MRFLKDFTLRGVATATAAVLTLGTAADPALAASAHTAIPHNYVSVRAGLSILVLLVCVAAFAHSLYELAVGHSSELKHHNTDRYVYTIIAAVLVGFFLLRFATIHLY